MKRKLKKLDGTTRQLEIELPKEMVEEALDAALEDIRKTAKVPGFRPGKAPLDIVKKKYTEDAVEEVKQRLIPRAYKEALDESGLAPISYPEVSDVSIGLNGILTFKAKVDIHPEVDPRKYKGLKVTTSKVSVTDEEVAETLEHMRGMHAEFVETDRPIQKNDFGICDVETFIDGQAVAKKREKMWIEADKDASMLGLGGDLCGMKKGESKDIEATLPEGYPDKKYAGKKAVFHVEVKETREKKLPELDDELAKKLKKNSLDELREELRSQLMERKGINAGVHMKNQIMEYLLKKNQFDLPASMVKRQLKVLMEKAENELASKGVDKKTIESRREELKSKLLKEAENKVRLYFILDEIANREKLNVTDEEVDNWLRSLAGSYNQSFDSVKKYYQDNDLIGGLKEQLREERTLDFLLSEATITGK